MTRVAVIGAGVGGLALAHALRGHAAVTVFEKARGVGGRTATRREGDVAFDHGAQCFTVRTPAFAAWLAPLEAAGIVAEWRGAVVTLVDGRVVGERFQTERHLVGVPGMNAIARHLAGQLEIRSGVEVAPLAAGGGPHRLTATGGEDLGSFDVVVSTAPPHQTAALFGEAGFGPAALGTSMKPCHALMAAFPAPWREPWVAAKVTNGPIRRISIDSTKPGRATGSTTIVAHTRSAWSKPVTEVPAEALAPALLAALRAALPVTLPEPSVVKVHRWKSALVGSSDRPGPWFDAAAGLGATGDWAASSRIEEVCLSALELARRLRERSG